MENKQDKVFSKFPSSVTGHELDMACGPVRYTACADTIVLDDEKGAEQAEIFSIAYFRQGCDKAGRPLTFAFNGGPGASSLWIHMGALGPRRVSFGEKVKQPAPRAVFEDNPHSWLGFTDLVFVDPVGTGYSRTLGEKDPKDYWGVDEDAASIAEFINRFCSRHRRWSSPKYLAGESYGGIRAVALCDTLNEKYGIDLDGMVLVSPAVDYRTFSHEPGNHIATACALPSYTALAHYHDRLESDDGLDTLLMQAEEFALDEYLPALAHGGSLDVDRRERIAGRLAALTGLSPEYIEHCNLVISPRRFAKELLRSDGLTLGRFDGRLTGVDSDSAGEFAQYDASDTLMTGAFVRAYNEHLHSALAVNVERPYVIQDSAIIKAWKWDGGNRRGQGFVNLGPVLRRQVAGNEHLRVLFLCGIYDIATPYFGIKYSVNNLGLTDELRKRVSLVCFQGGHMMYTDQANHEKLADDVALFYSGGSRD